MQRRRWRVAATVRVLSGELFASLYKIAQFLCVAIPWNLTCRLYEDYALCSFNAFVTPTCDLGEWAGIN
eukprot:m.467247 g.467247  ORF g.467247 m.467247 type:complete len:69 (+) comp26073_c0_seq1:1659-1865(+)